MNAKKPTPAELQAFRQVLLDLRARLRGDVTAITDNALNKASLDGSVEQTTMPIHMADVGSDNFEQEFSLSLMMAGSDRLEQVDAALKRIDAGTFGICENCGTTIPKARLHAIPFASLCVPCAEKGEG